MIYHLGGYSMKVLRSPPHLPNFPFCPPCSMAAAIESPGRLKIHSDSPSPLPANPANIGRLCQPRSACLMVFLMS